MFDTKVAKVLDENGNVLNRIVLQVNVDPSDFNAVWDDEATKIVVETKVRTERDRLLVERIDVIAMNPLRYDSLTDEEKAELAEKRQMLLDLPEQEGFPFDVTWPKL